MYVYICCVYLATEAQHALLVWFGSLLAERALNVTEHEDLILHEIDCRS